MPRVSVLMPVFNTNERFLREAIESVLQQTYHDFEFLIINDGSTSPDVERVIRSYGDERIKYSANPSNQTIWKTRNHLIEMAQGQYLATMDSDDISLPERIEKQVAYLDEHADVGVIGCFKKDIVKNRYDRYPIEHEAIQEKLMFGCCFAHPATMIRKSVLVENKLAYEEVFSPADDYALWCRLIDKTRFYNIPEYLLGYRNHKNNISHRQAKNMLEATLAIKSFVRRTHADIWERARARATTTTRVKLLGLLPIITVNKYGNSKVVRLLGVIPLYSSKTTTKLD